MAALKAILTALSLLVIAIIYSDIVENEAELSTSDSQTGRKVNLIYIITSFSR